MSGILLKEILKYGMKILDNKIISIDDVESGLACNCKCPACGSPLIANKGIIKTHYFSHFNAAECFKGGETALHFKAKEIFTLTNSLILPSLVPQSNNSSYLLMNPTFNYTEAFIEKKIADFIPDICLVNGDVKLLIEIVVTHEIDASKDYKLKIEGIPVLVIDLSSLEGVIDDTTFKDILLNESINKYWYLKPNKELQYLQYINKLMYDPYKIKPLPHSFNEIAKTGYDEPKCISGGFCKWRNVDKCYNNLTFNLPTSYQEFILSKLDDVVLVNKPDANFQCTNQNHIEVLSRNKHLLKSVNKYINLPDFSNTYKIYMNYINPKKNRLEFINRHDEKLKAGTNENRIKFALKLLEDFIIDNFDVTFWLTKGVNKLWLF